MIFKLKGKKEERRAKRSNYADTLWWKSTANEKRVIIYILIVGRTVVHSQFTKESSSSQKKCQITDTGRMVGFKESRFATSSQGTDSGKDQQWVPRPSGEGRGWLHKDSPIPQIASQLTLMMERTGCHHFNQLTKLRVIKRGQPDVRVVPYHAAHSIVGEVATPKTSHRNLLKPWPQLPVGMGWRYRLNGTVWNQTKPQCRTFHQTGLGSQRGKRKPPKQQQKINVKRKG